jgi:AmmeMemoRadiSam system protein B
LPISWAVDIDKLYHLSKMTQRKPAAAGSFYPGTIDSLQREIVSSFTSPFGPGSLPKVNPNKEGKIKALICPHAGYVYSGAVAAKAYYSLAVDHTPERVLLVGPNHTGFGTNASLYPEGKWLTPLGELAVDNSWLNDALSDLISKDERAHLYEHSLEVQLPFIQYLFGSNISISALTLGNQAYDFIKKLANLFLKSNLPFIIATSDLSHYEPAPLAQEKDKALIKELEAVNAEGIYEQIAEKNISACGPGAMALIALLAKENKWKVEVLSYLTSGDITGDKTSVVGYLSAQAKED